MISGAVSPPTRAMPRRAPVTSEVAHDGRTTRRMARYRGMPRARAASLAEVGTSRMASSEVRATIGIMIVASDDRRDHTEDERRREEAQEGKLEDERVGEDADDDGGGLGHHVHEEADDPPEPVLPVFGEVDAR